MANSIPFLGGDGDAVILQTKVKVVFNNGTASFISLTNFGAGGQGAALDTLATANGGIAMMKGLSFSS